MGVNKKGTTNNSEGVRRQDGNFQFGEERSGKNPVERRETDVGGQANTESQFDILQQISEED